MKYYLVQMVYYNQRFIVRAESKYRAKQKCAKELQAKGKGMFMPAYDFDVIREIKRPINREMEADVCWL